MNHSLPGPNCYWGIRTNEHGGLTAAAVCRDYPTQGVLFHTESSGRSPQGWDCYAPVGALCSRFRLWRLFVAELPEVQHPFTALTRTEHNQPFQTGS